MGAFVSLEFRLHPLTTVLSGFYPWSKPELLHRLNEFIATNPDELTIRLDLPDPRCQMALFLHRPIVAR